MSSAQALRAVAGFQCLADRCEDTCCIGLKVPVNEAGQTRLRAALSGSDEDQSLLASALPETGAEAFFRPRADGSCHFLSAHRLCSLHARFGAAALPDPCATFPRLRVEANGTTELVGSLACPEIVRRALLDGAGLEPVAIDMDAGALAQIAKAAELSVDGVRARALALRLCARAEFPLASRLMFIAHAGAALAEIPEQHRDELYAAFGDQERLAVQHANVRAVSAPADGWLALFATMVRTRRQTLAAPRFASLADAVLGLWSDRGAAAERQRKLAALGGEDYLVRFARYSLLRRPPQDGGHLLPVAVDLLLRVALLRWFWAGHPALAPERVAQDELQRALVEAVQVLAKYVEPGPELEALRAQLLRGSTADRFGRALLLSKVE